MKPQIILSIVAVLMTGCGKPTPPDISIHEAATEGGIEAIKQHLAAGTDPNSANLGERYLEDFINPPLHYSKNKEVAELLIAGGADVNFKDQIGTAILHYWAFFPYGETELIELLIANGANVNIKDSLGNTPLDKAIEGSTRWHKAAREERVKIATILRKHGGVSGAMESIVAAVNSGNVEAVKKHISNGGEESKKIKDVFSRAVQLDHAEIVDLLLASGTDLKAKLDGLLHHVKSVEVANLLLENGANVKANSQIGATPLHSIILRRSAVDLNQNNTVQLVELLITKKANVNAVNDQGRTPLDLLQSSGMAGNPAADWNGAPSGPLAELLRKHGGKRGEELEAVKK